MHYVVVAMLEMLCCIHAYRTGQERYWIFIIFCFPVIGCVAYFVMVMLPETGADRHGRTLLMRLQDKINPERHRSEEHTSELQSRFDLVCRLLLEKKNTRTDITEE